MKPSKLLKMLKVVGSWREGIKMAQVLRALSPPQREIARQDSD
jgi:hypothetical protein